jgi:hypothetical protein
MSEEAVKLPYYLITASEGQESTCISFNDRCELVAAIKVLRQKVKSGRQTRIFVIRGERLQTTVPPYPYLIEVGQQPVALFDHPQMGVVSDSGDLLGDVQVKQPLSEYVLATQAAIAEHKTLIAQEEEEEELLEDES